MKLVADSDGLENWVVLKNNQDYIVLLVSFVCEESILEFIMQIKNWTSWGGQELTVSN